MDNICFIPCKAVDNKILSPAELGSGDNKLLSLGSENNLLSPVQHETILGLSCVAIDGYIISANVELHPKYNVSDNTDTG